MKFRRKIYLSASSLKSSHAFSNAPTSNGEERITGAVILTNLTNHKQRDWSDSFVDNNNIILDIILNYIFKLHNDIIFRYNNNILLLFLLSQPVVNLADGSI